MYYKHKQLPHHGAAVILCHCPQKPFNEVIAAALEDVIAGDRVQEFKMKAEGINKSLGAKIKKFFQDICDLFKEILDVYKNVLTGMQHRGQADQRASPANQQFEIK